MIRCRFKRAHHGLGAGIGDILPVRDDLAVRLEQAGSVELLIEKVKVGVIENADRSGKAETPADSGAGHGD